MKFCRFPGVIIAFTIFIFWLVFLVVLLSLDLPSHLGTIVGGIVVQTFLYTGLFLTARDAIHSSIAPGKHRINRTIGY